MLSRKKWEKIIPRAREAKPLCDLSQLFFELDRKGISFGIGSSSPRDWVWKLIELHCPYSYFTTFNVVCGDEVMKGKPDPEVWQRIARGISDDRSPNDCLVVEDGLAGIEGAMAAGMRSALILPNKHPEAIQINNVCDVLKIV
jgi:beta-phosphoglucomutase-like phosphatase (HAD superfamily)